MISKKENERHILNLIYDENEYAEIIESESPDFRIRHKETDSYFGVEITEFYYSESNARLRKIPSYFNEILEQDHYRHKHDKKILKAEDFTINSSEGQFKQKSRGIIQKLPQLSEYANMIANKIAIKSSKFDEYDHSLTHTNLVIFDAERRLNFAPIGDFYRYFFTEEIKNILYATCFREVFLITVLEKNHPVYIPLKLLLLFADFHMFGTLIVEYPWEISDDCEDQPSEIDLSTSPFMLMFAKYMRSKTEHINFRERDGQVEVVLGNSSIWLESGRKIICDYGDYPQPSDLQTVSENELTDFFQSSEFCEKAKEILEGATFYTDIAKDLKGTLSS